MKYPTNILSDLLKKIKNIQIAEKEDFNQTTSDNSYQENDRDSYKKEIPLKSLGPRRTSSTSGTDTNSL